MTADPRVLDKKNKTADEEKPEETYVTYREPVTDEKGVQTYKVHGPMPTSEWAAYEKEHNL